jgi:hypothetical protein
MIARGSGLRAPAVGTFSRHGPREDESSQRGAGAVPGMTALHRTDLRRGLPHHGVTDPVATRLP